MGNDDVNFAGLGDASSEQMIDPTTAIVVDGSTGEPARRLVELAQPPSIEVKGIKVPTEPFTQFTIPKRFLSRKWAHAGRQESDRCFGMVELTTGRQKRASKYAGQMELLATMQAQQMLCVYHIGGVRVGGDITAVERWRNDMGQRAWLLVEHAYNTINMVEDSDLESFAETGELVDV